MYQVVLCTCPDNTVAQTIAKALVSSKLAACVNILPNIQSIYRWQGNIEVDQEVQLVIKTKTSKFGLLNDTIGQLHPYDVPEVIAIDINQGDHTYLQWLEDSLTHD